MPLFAVETLEPEMLADLGGFTRRMQWFLDNVPAVAPYWIRVKVRPADRGACWRSSNRTRLLSVLRYMLDESEFLSPHGVRALSRYHRDHPFVFRFNGTEYRVDYEPGESVTGTFGGNSNWRGPVWFPMNFLLIEALQKYHYYYGDELTGRVSHGFRKPDDFVGGRGDAFAPPDTDLPALRRRLVARSTDPIRSSSPIRTGATSFCFTNISMAIPAPASAPATRPVGRASWQNSWSRAGSAGSRQQAEVRVQPS